MNKLAFALIGFVSFSLSLGLNHKSALGLYRDELLSTSFEVVNASTGQCLDVQFAGFFPRTPVWLYQCNQTDAQQWRAQPVPGKPDFYYLRVSASSYCLDVPGNRSQEIGLNLWIWECNKTDAQQFNLKGTYYDDDSDYRNWDQIAVGGRMETCLGVQRPYWSPWSWKDTEPYAEVGGYCDWHDAWFLRRSANRASGFRQFAEGSGAVALSRNDSDRPDPVSAPEPGVGVGLLGVAGFIAWRKRKAIHNRAAS